jgi:hypothetical protein
LAQPFQFLVLVEFLGQRATAQPGFNENQSLNRYKKNRAEAWIFLTYFKEYHSFYIEDINFFLIYKEELPSIQKIYPFFEK